jgi:ATP-dependent DNA helicase RecG
MGRDLSEFDIQYVKGVGPRKAALLNRLGIRTVHDALFYLPVRYEDRRGLEKIRDITPGALHTVVGKVVSSEVVALRGGGRKLFGPPGRGGGLSLFELSVSDGSGVLKGKWFNQPFLKKRFRAGQEVVLSGIVKPPFRGSALEMENPEYELLGDGEDDLIHTARVVPVYGATENLSARQLRSIMFNVIQGFLDELADPLPGDMLERLGLPGLGESVLNAHFPGLGESVLNAHFPDAGADVAALNARAAPCQRRLSFEELFMLEAGFALIRKDKAREQGISFRCEGTLLARLLESLPFSLTGAQSRAFAEIRGDMESPEPMHRLLQGDVGSGKTVVALMAMLTAHECGHQSALMAPTEILAEQHYMNVHRMVEDMGLKPCLLTGSTRQRPLEEIAKGEVDVVVGTHALIEEGVRFRKLGLVVIDEQHRFGVAQRAVLRKKALNPDVLIMTATPIPRTLSLALYGDLDVSVIGELPPERTPVKTSLYMPDRKGLIYGAIEEEVRGGGQVYVVYPVIEGSEKTSLRSAMTGEEALKKMFPRMRTALLHGRMKTAEKETVMAGFKEGKIDILVSTTVVEVGVDVPNASMMLIVHSQLHQLRGRVGRGRRQSRCLLLAYGPIGEDAKRRLDVMCSTTDGFRVSEEDLGIRGPGDFLGTRQSGLPNLRVADIVRDAALLEGARKEAFALVGKDPSLEGRFWRGKVELVATG